MRHASVGILLLISMASCGPPPLPKRAADDAGTDAGPAPDAGRDARIDGGHDAGSYLNACAQQPAMLDTVAQVVTRLNALPRPVNAACLVAGLMRPLRAVATTSVMSAQPSGGQHSPRIFLITPTLVVAVVPEGAGANLIELGQWVTLTRTLKGELELPITAALAPDAPLTRIAQPNGTTTCSLCHRAESPLPSIDGGYVSAAFRPNPGTEVMVPALAAEHQACVDSADSSSRCQLFHALFDFGPMRQGEFSSSVEVFP